MALPWISTVTAEIAAVLPFLQRAVRENIGADTLYRYLHDGGYEVARSEIREAMSELRAGYFAIEYIRNLPREYVPDPTLIPPSLTRQLLPFRYTFDVTAINAETGEEETLTRSLLSSELLDKATAEEEMGEVLMRYGAEMAGSLQSVSVVGITRRA